MRETRYRRLHIIWFNVNGFLKMAQLLAQKYICGCQDIGVEEGVWWQIAQGSIFEPVEHFLYFYCGSIYTMVCICQSSTNGNALTHWLLSYINYISTLLTLFWRKRNFHIFTYWLSYPSRSWAHKHKNRIWNFSRTWPTSRIPHSTFVFLWQDTETWF